MPTFRVVVDLHTLPAEEVANAVPALAQTSGIDNPEYLGETRVAFNRSIRHDDVPIGAVRVACEEALMRGLRNADFTGALGDLAIEIQPLELARS